jgi:LPXTG-motif cell wall-anchored protein
MLLLLFGSVASAADDTTVLIRQDAKLGSYLTDSKGMTLYLFKKDTPNTTVCYDACAKAWPPFSASGTLSLPSGVSGSLGTITRKDGTTQITYNDTPLYYYAPDKGPGDVKGQGVGNVWFVMAPQTSVTRLPATGGVPVGLALIAGMLVVGGGIALRKR